MKLLTIEEIQRGLDIEFAPLEPALTGYRLLPKTTDENKVKAVEHQLRVIFPDEFRKSISEFDFGNLTIGPVAFCFAGDYLKELIDLNSGTRWWGSGDRPRDLLMVANSDPFAILLNVDDGSVHAMDSQQGVQSGFKIAENFRLFFLGLGTAMLKRNEVPDPYAFATDIGSTVGSGPLDFWMNLVR